VYEPLDLIAKLAALIPRPYKNLILYHAVLAANAAWRKRAVAYGRNAAPPSELGHPDAPQHKRRQWADLMRRAFGYDLLSCPNCGSKMLLLACVTERGAIRKILTHLGLPPDPPALARVSRFMGAVRHQGMNRDRARRACLSTSARNAQKSTNWAQSPERTARSCALPRGRISQKS
jgi:hypothetical protein